MNVQDRKELRNDCVIKAYRILGNSFYKKGKSANVLCCISKNLYILFSLKLKM